MADNESEERINFAHAKSLFQKDGVKPVHKSHSATTLPSHKSETLASQKSDGHKNIQNGDSVDSKITIQPQISVGKSQDNSEPSHVKKSMTTPTSLFDFSAEAPKANFVIPKKRGDTSDLKWLMSVHHSKPVMGHSVSYDPRSDMDHASKKSVAGTNGTETKTGFDHNRSSAGSVARSTSYGGKTFTANEISSNTMQYGKTKTTPGSYAAASTLPKVTKQTIAEEPKVNSMNVENGVEKAEKVEKTPVVKSTMTVSLNAGGGGGGSGGKTQSKVIEQTAPGFSAVLEQIQARKIMTINEQSPKSMVESNLGQPQQAVNRSSTPSPPPLPHEPPPLPSGKIPEKIPEPFLPPALPQAPPPVQSVKKSSSDDMEEDEGHRRIRLKNWNPTKLMKDLYQITLRPEVDVATNYINIEGYLEKLPISKTKDTFLKTWKRRYFRAYNGSLYYHESESEKKESGNFKLDGGKVEEIGERMIGIEDGRGHYLVLRSTSDKEYMDWKRALHSQTAEGIQSHWVKPILRSAKSNSKKIIILELGSCAIRAGVLGDSVALPDIFLPTIVATHRETGQRMFCYDALLPETRGSSTLSYPIRPTPKVDKYSIDWDSMPGIFEHVFHQLNVNPSQYSVLFSTPTSFSDKIKSQFMELFVNRFKVSAINMTSQTILALHSYQATSGVIVDIGDRIEILPVADGYVVEGGVTRVPYGGQMITDALNRSFTDRRYRFSTDVEFQIVRLAMEKLCYVASNYKSEMENFHKNPEKFNVRLQVDSYDLPAGSFDDISNDHGRFQSPEGLFDTFFWGLDNPPIQEMIQKAIQACPIDTRRQMWRSVYLSGGVTLLKGFTERLQKELSKLAPSAVTVQVHAAPNRYHSSYLGASALALMPAFDNGCIAAADWRQSGQSLLKKWKAY